MVAPLPARTRDDAVGAGPEGRLGGRSVLEPRPVVRRRELAVTEAVDEDDDALRLPLRLEDPDLVGALAERAVEADARRRGHRGRRAAAGCEEREQRDSDPLRARGLSSRA